MSGLTIDPEFRDLIPPLSKDERDGLESNIIAYGCHSPIFTWDGIIIDGHNRYEICTKHDIEFDTAEWDFSDRTQARIWIIRNQFDRRNLTAPARMDLALLLKADIQTAAQMRQIRKPKSVVENLPQQNSEPTKTRDEVAKLAGVSGRTLDKYEAVKNTGSPGTVTRRYLRKRTVAMQHLRRENCYM
jgi:hypothetical protein